MGNHRFTIPTASVGRQQATGLQHGEAHLFTAGYSRLIVAGLAEVSITFPAGPAGFMPVDVHGEVHITGIPTQHVSRDRVLIALTSVERAGIQTPYEPDPNQHGRIMKYFWCHMGARDQFGGWWYRNRFPGGYSYSQFMILGGIDTYYMHDQPEPLTTTMRVIYHLMEVESQHE